MKKIFSLLMCLALLSFAFVPSAAAQSRRTKRNLTTAGIIGGGALVGAIIGGKKGAAIGAGGGALYALNRDAAVRHYNPRTRQLGTVLGGAALGAGLGGAIGHGRGAAIGAITGAAGSYIYTKKSSRYPNGYYRYYRYH